MKKAEMNPNAEQQWISGRIGALDLEPIMVKLMDPVEGEAWTLEQALDAALWYRRFLYLNALYPDRSIVPTPAMDTFWHYHILDTQKYADDCQLTFGYFLHHFPYFGMRGEEDKQNLMEASGETWKLFRQHFNEVPATRLESKCTSSCTGKSCSHCQAPTCSSGPNKISNTHRPRLSAN